MKSAYVGKKKIRVLVVDDSAFVRRAIVRMLDGSASIQVVDVASDGEMALELIKRLRPDVVTLDIKMPVMDGLTALKRIMNDCPTPVVILSSLAEKGGENTIRALELGAVDFINKSSAGGPMNISAIGDELTSKILVAAQVDLHKLGYRLDMEGKSPPLLPSLVAKPLNTELVLLGTSTGGPPALQAVLSKIPANFPCPIMIVQHMPVGFTASLAERLNRMSPIQVKEAVNGEPVLPGCAYLAPAGKHMKLDRIKGQLYVRLDVHPQEATHCPSVDVLFESAAALCADRCLAVVLTGMGRDGSIGAEALKRGGGRVIAESEETSIVFGMPKAVTESVKVDSQIPLYDVANAILRMI